MTNFHCPETYRKRDYGCGFGPIHATRAFLDYGGTCPKCGVKLMPHRAAKVTHRALPGVTCSVLSVMGTRYCHLPAHNGPFCKRHAHEAYC